MVSILFLMLVSVISGTGTVSKSVIYDLNLSCSGLSSSAFYLPQVSLVFAFQLPLLEVFFFFLFYFCFNCFSISSFFNFSAESVFSCSAILDFKISFSKRMRSFLRLLFFLFRFVLFLAVLQFFSFPQQVFFFLNF